MVRYRGRAPVPVFLARRAASGARARSLYLARHSVMPVSPGVLFDARAPSRFPARFASLDPVPALLSFASRLNGHDPTRRRGPLRVRCPVRDAKTRGAGSRFVEQSSDQVERLSSNSSPRLPLISVHPRNGIPNHEFDIHRTRWAAMYIRHSFINNWRLPYSGDCAASDLVSRPSRYITPPRSGPGTPPRILLSAVFPIFLSSD